MPLDRRPVLGMRLFISLPDNVGACEHPVHELNSSDVVGDTERIYDFSDERRKRK